MNLHQMGNNTTIQKSMETGKKTIWKKIYTSTTSPNGSGSEFIHKGVYNFRQKTNTDEMLQKMKNHKHDDNKMEKIEHNKKTNTKKNRVGV